MKLLDNYILYDNKDIKSILSKVLPGGSVVSEIAEE